MHTPRIFTTPVMSGYAYSGLSSTEYKDSLCRAITSGVMPYDECLKVIHEFVMELRSTFGELRGVDAVFAAVDKIDSIDSCITDAEGASSAEPKVQAGVLHSLINRLYDALQDCTTAPCNKEVQRFMDVSFIRRSAHLEIAKACGILVNTIVIVHCLATTVSKTSCKVLYERDADSAFHASMTLSAYTNAQFSALSRCLNSCPGPEETRRRKAILRVVRHNMELCNKVSELISPDMLLGFRHRTDSCIQGILDAVKASSAECEEIVSTGESAQRRLAIARKATLGLMYYLKAYRGLGVARDYRRFKQLGGYASALVDAMGSLCSMYRGYASTGNAEHVVASKIEHCLKILLSFPSTRQHIGEYKARKVYFDMCSVYEDLEQNLEPELLLNPGAEVKLRDAALRSLSEMMEIWEREYGGYFNAVEQTGGSPSQPSTSGLGSTSAGMGGSQTPYMPPHDPGMMPYSYAQPSTLWDQPSTSGMGGTGLGSQQASYMPPHDPGIMPHAYAQPSTSYAHPSTSWDQPSTSGLGSTSAGMGGSQTPYMPPHDPGMMPYSYAQPSTLWDQPSTSGMGGTGLGSQQASYMPPHDPGIMPHAYAQPSTSYAQPSTSGLGSTAGVGSTQVSYMPPHDPGIVPHAYAQPSTSYAQPSTSGLGSTAGVGSTQVSYMPPHDPGIVPHAYAQPSTSYAQPSTSGLGSTAGVGSTQVSYMPPQDQGIMPHAYAQPSTSYAHPSTSWDQPSTSGLGDASSELEEAQVSSHRSRTPSDDSEPPSKRSRSA